MVILKKRNQSYFYFIFFTVLFFLFHTLVISATNVNNQEKGIISHHLDWMQSLNKDIPALANRDNSLRVNDLFQQGNLLAVHLCGYQDYQGDERTIDKIMAIDLSTCQIRYEKILYDTKTFMGLYGNDLIYSYKENNKKDSEGYKLKIIDLDKKNAEKELEGTIEQITPNGYLVSRYSGHIIDIKKKEVVFSHEYLKGYSTPLTSSGFFMKDKNKQGNWDKYQFINYQGKIIFSLPNINKTYLPENETDSTLSFPIPILKEEENEENIIQFIDASGQVVDTYPLSEIGITGTAFGRNHLPYGHLKILAQYEQKYILEIEVSTQEEKGKETILWFDGQQNKFSILEEDIRVMVNFHATGHFMMLVESESKYGHFTLKYYDPEGDCLWEKYLPPNIDGWVELYPINSESILLYDNHSAFFRYSLIDGQLTGIYPFPIDYRIELANVFDNQVYVLTGQKRNDTELEGNHLVSFPLGNTGWFDFELVKVNPLAGSPLTVYEDREIELEFQSGQYVLAEEQLEIHFDKGEFLDQSSRYGGRWDCQWQSPELIDKDEETVNITATYGPISKNYQVVVKNLENPLILTGELKVDSRHQDQLILEGKIQNTAHQDIDNLDWQWELDNLAELSSSFPNHISAQREKSFRMRFNRLAINEDQWEKIDWNGYEIAQQAKLTCEYPEGSCEQIFKQSLQIEPTYFISLRLFDPASQHYWGRKDLEKIDLSEFSIWDDQHNNITANFQMKKNNTKNRIMIQNIAPGLKNKPTRIEVRYPGSSKWLELYFQQEEHPKFPEIAVKDFDYSLPITGSFLIEIVDHANQNVLKDVAVTLVKKDDNGEYQDLEEKQTDDEGICHFDTLSPGEYRIETSKEAYIPHNIKLPRILSSVHYQEENYDLAQGEQQEIQLEMHPYSSVVFYAESYYDSFHEDKSKVALLKSVGLNEASDHVFIIPEGVEYVFLQFLYKIGYPEDAAAFGFFAEDTYKVELDIMDEDDSYIVMADHSRGEGIRELKEEDIYIRGDQSPQKFGEGVLKVNEIKKPISFDFKIRTSLSDDWKESTIWLFPSEWLNYEKEALQVSLLYPLKGKTGMFDYAATAREFLKDKDSEIDIKAALLPVINYGINSLQIFGIIPDLSFKNYVKDNAVDFIQWQLEEALKKSLSVAKVTVTSELLGAVQMIISAIEWGAELENVVKEGTSIAYGPHCVGNLANRVNLVHAERLMNVLKETFLQLITAIENNQPDTVRTIVEDIRTIVVGDNPGGLNPSDYEIDYEQFGIKTVKNTTGYALYFGLTFELANIIDCWEDSYATCFDKYIQDEASIIELEAASDYALASYKPIIKNLVNIASIPMSVVLIEVDR